MRTWQGKTYWIVGGSTGLGEAVAKALSSFGANVILSARTEEDLAAAANAMPGKVRTVQVDVSDTESVAKAAEEVGDIDGLVYLAGVYWPMSSREFDGEKAAQMIDINLIGAVRVLGHVVPAMLAKKQGHIVLTGSLAGFRGLPKAVGYGASKAGIMSLAETMRADLHGSGVEVQLVNPGFIKTRMTDKNEFKMPLIMEPERAARLFVEHMNRDSFSANFPWQLASGIRGASNFLPDWLYYRLIGKAL